MKILLLVSVLGLSLTAQAGKPFGMPNAKKSGVVGDSTSTQSKVKPKTDSKSCFPLDQPFSVQGVMFATTAYGFQVGELPGKQVYGKSILSADAGVQSNLALTGVDGTASFELPVTALSSSYKGQQGIYIVGGHQYKAEIQLSLAAQQDIYYRFADGPAGKKLHSAAELKKMVCISAFGAEISADTVNGPFRASIYLYINGTKNGYILSF